MGEGERGSGGGRGRALKLEEKEDEEEKEDVWPGRRASGIFFTFFAVMVVCAYVGVDRGEYSN